MTVIVEVSVQKSSICQSNLGMEDEENCEKACGDYAPSSSYNPGTCYTRKSPGSHYYGR